MAWWKIWLVAAVTGMLGLVACGSDGDGASPEGATTSASPVNDAGELTGQIAFMRGDPAEGGSIYTIDPDGSDERELFTEGASRPTWSPDGTEIQVFCCNDGMVAHFIDPSTGEMVRTLPPPDPSLETFCGGAWSADGQRVACETFGVDDPDLNGIYTIRASDGGGLRRITANRGGNDIPGDFSPDGERLVFVRWVDEEPVGVFVTELDGSGLVQISPPEMMVDDSGFAGSWSPDGSQILIVARESDDHHKAIWIVGADGSSPRLFEMTPPCGGTFSDTSSAGCYSPSWSPDGSMIVFTRSSPDGQTENIHVVAADGTGLVQLTDGGIDDNADWGTPPDDA